MEQARKILLLSLLLRAVSSDAAPFPSPTPQSGQDPRITPDERSLAYQYDAELGWFPKPNNEVSYTGTRTIHIAHNEMGFRDKPHTREKTRPRLIFLGDSFVWGYDVEEGERFTEFLQAELPSIEVINLGVSGYGTDQCYLLLRKFFDFYDPDAVIYMFSETDIRDNSVNFNYKAYYKPYYVLRDGELKLKGVPVPRSSVWTRWMKSIADQFPHLRNKADVTPHLISAMDDFVKSNGTSFAVGLIDDHPAVRQHLTDNKIVFFDVSHVDQRYRYPEHGFHWTPQGHQVVARTIQAFLVHNTASARR
jgi:lysophospholipase L1-like esterase